MTAAMLVLAAAPIMVTLAAVPRRHRGVQALMVIGWAAVWVDNAFGGSWLDVAGMALVLVSLVWLVWPRPLRGRLAPGGDQDRPVR